MFGVISQLVLYRQLLIEIKRIVWHFFCILDLCLGQLVSLCYIDSY